MKQKIVKGALQDRHKRARGALRSLAPDARYEHKQFDGRQAKRAVEKAKVESRLAAVSLEAAAHAEHGRNFSYIQAVTARLEERWLELQGEL